MDDRELLNEYVQRGSQQAFALLVERHIGMVYAAARRQVGDGALADDVTQAVFIVLARRAAHISSPAGLCGWLLKTTRYACMDVLKTERRRKHHEQKAAEQAAMIDQGPEPVSEHPQASLLDGALAALSDQDRNVVALRYVQGQSVREVAQALGISEEAAGKRTRRAVDRMRRFFSRHGAATTSAALVAGLEASAQGAVPPGLAATVCQGALTAGKASAAVGIASGVVFTMQMAKLKTTAALLILGLGVSAAAALVARQVAGLLAATAVVRPADPPAWRYAAHTATVWGLATSPDGQRFVSGADDGLVCLWDMASAQPIWSRRFAPAEKYVHCVAFSPDGAFILVGTYGGTLALLDAQSGSEIRRFVGHSDNVIAVGFSPDGRLAFSVSGNKVARQNRDASLRMWEVATGQAVHPPFPAKSELASLAVAPDGQSVACGGVDRIISIVDVATGQAKAVLSEQAARIQCLAFSPDGRTLLSGTDDGSLYLWDLASRSIIRRFEAHLQPVQSVQFTSDGRRFLSSACDGTIRLWDSASGQELCCLDARSGACRSAIFTRDEQAILGGYNDGSIRLWRVPLLK